MLSVPLRVGGQRSQGTYTQEEALDLANILKAGKLAAPAKIVQEQQVGPTLGKQAIQGGYDGLPHFIHCDLRVDAGIL